MKVLLNDPPLQRETGDAKYLPLEQLFNCDFITFHTPLTFEGLDKTFHLADDKFFNSLRPGCVFINTSRGGIVDTEALKSAIRSAKLKAAVLDVWENEPNIDTELLQMVDLGTQHIAGYSLDGKTSGMIMIYEAACKHFGLEPEFDIDSFLPTPAVPQLKLNTQSADEQDLLHETVEKLYRISEDDAALRRILDKPTSERGKFFHRLRKDYPVRREFRNTRIVLDGSSQTLGAKLAGIGFTKIENK